MPKLKTNRGAAKRFRTAGGDYDIRSTIEQMLGAGETNAHAAAGDKKSPAAQLCRHCRGA